MVPAELRALLQACKDAPDDDTQRLVLADWLDDHGQADRAEFVRLSVRLAAEEIPPAAEAPSLGRLHELYSRHADDWLGTLRDWPGRCVFRRGLIEVHCHLSQLGAIDGAAPPGVLPWLETLILEYGQQKGIGQLLTIDALRHFTAIDITDVRLNGPWLEKFGNSPRVAHLRRLRVAPAEGQKATGVALATATQLGGLRVLEFAEGMGDGSLVALAQAPWFAGLSTLAIRWGSGLRKTAPAWAQSPHAPRLKRIDFDFVQPGKAGFRELAASPLLAEVVEMRLEDAYIGPAEAEALTSRREWPRLRRLVLEDNRIDEQAMQALASDTRFTALRSLNLKNNTLDPGGLRALLAAPWIGGVERLDLTRNPVGDEGAKVLACAPALANLRHLDVSWCGISAAGVRALAGSPHFARLETLELGLDENTSGDEALVALTGGGGLPVLAALTFNSSLSAKAVHRLAASPLAARLRALDLSRNDLDGRAVAALAAPALAGLTDLQLAFNRVDEKAAAALAAGPFRRLVRLNLRGCGLRDAGVRALLRPDAFPALALLDLFNYDYSGPDANTLLAWPRLRHLAWLHTTYHSGDDPLLLRLMQPVAFSLRE